MSEEKKEPVDKIVELADKNIDRLVEKIAELGPEAQYAFNETIANISVKAWGNLIVIILVLFGSLTALRLGLKYGKEVDWDDSSVPFVIIPGVFSVFAIIIFMTVFPGELATALHPVGYLVLEILK